MLLYQRIYATPVGTGALTDGDSRVVMQDAAPVRTGDGRVVLTGIDGTHLSTTRDAGTYATMARSGNVTAVGDTSFLAPSAAFEADNEALIGNLAEFLTSAEKSPYVPAIPEDERGGAGPGQPRPPAAEPGAESPTPADGAAAAC